MAAPEDIVSHVTRFCRALREEGLLAGPSETSESIRALGHIDLMSREQVYWAMRSLLVCRRDEIARFDRLFEDFWRFRLRRDGTGFDDNGARFRPLETGRHGASFLVTVEGEGTAGDPGGVIRTGASPAEVRSPKDLSSLGPDVAPELSRIAARMLKALATQPGRRRRRHRRKGIVDVRGALRLSLSTGGEPIRLPRRRRVRRVPRLMVLLDVSGSMSQFSGPLLQLVFALTQRTRRVESLVFSTSVTRVTRQMKAPSYGDALRRLSRVADDWSGGTRIGESLAYVNDIYGSLQTRHTTVFLLSDGWDTGEPDHLAREIRRMRRRVRGIVWLNPLIGTPGYEPLTRGLRAVRPYIDSFVSATDLDDLRRLPSLLGV